MYPTDITAAPRSSFGSVGDDDTSLTVHWNAVADAAGYIIMATSYTGTLRNETLTRVVLDPTSSSAVIPFDIECASKFTFKVAPFNSLGIGPYSEEVEVGTQNEHCVATNSECNMYLFHGAVQHCLMFACKFTLNLWAGRNLVV